MFAKEPNEKAYLLYLVIGLVSFFLLSINLIADFIPGIPKQFEVTDFWQSVFVAWIFIGHLLYFKSITETKELFNVEQVLSYILLFGLIALPLNHTREILSWFNFTWFPTYLESTLLSLLRIYSVTIYFMIGLLLFKKLVFVKRTKVIILRWNVFFALLAVFTVIDPIKKLFDIEINDAFYYILIGAGSIIGLSLMIQIKWVALLSNRGKLRSMAFLFLINSISILLIIKLLEVYDNYIIQSHMIHNVFLILVIGFSSLYGIISMLALFFNLPVASVMDQQKNEIESFQEISQIINNKVNIQSILELLFNSCLTNTHAEGGWLTYKLDIKTGEKKTLSASNISEEEIVAFDDVINKHNIIYAEMPIEYSYTPNLKKNDRLKKVQTTFRSLVICPIIIDNVIIGKMVLMKSFYHGFDEYMIKLALTYIDQAKIAIENTKLFREILETERLKEELEIAEKIQKSLLAHDFPENGYCQIAGYSESAKEVGGDYYDFTVLDDKRSALVIGDVSGKGTSAAFHMAELKGIFQVLIQQDISPMEFMIRTNKALNNCLERNLFITLSYFVIDSNDDKIIYSRAGHCPALYYSKGSDKTYFFEDEGIGLGIIRSDKFSDYISQYEKVYHKDDVLLLYSDGIVEARNSKTGEEYGYEKLERCLSKNSGLSAEEIKKAIITDLDDFIRDADRMDDVTLLVLRFL